MHHDGRTQWHINTLVHHPLIGTHPPHPAPRGALQTIMQAHQLPRHRVPLWVGTHAGPHGPPERHALQGVNGPRAQDTQVVGEVTLMQRHEAVGVVDQSGVGRALSVGGGGAHLEEALDGGEQVEEHAEQHVAQVTQL